MKRILFIICSEYPYGLGEPFLENEISYYKNYDKVVIMPCFCKKIDNKREIPFNNYEIIKSNSKFSQGNKFSRFIYSLKVIITRDFFSELITMSLNNKMSVKGIFHMISFLSKGKYFTALARKWIKQNTDESDQIDIYSYWLYFQAYIAVNLKDDNEKRNCVARAHRFDLYEYQNANDYIPFRKYILSRIDKIYLISQNGYDYLSKRYSEYKYKMNISFLGSYDHGHNINIKKTRTLRIVSCSWVVPVKRINRIIECLSKITEINVSWVHLGDGKLLPEIKKMSLDLLKSNINYEFKGKMTNSEVLKYYLNNDIDVFLNVSENEGIPVSIMEAISIGMPVIATDVGGVNEIITDGVNGFLLEKDFSDEQLKKLLLRIYGMNEGSYINLRKNARGFWEENYNAEKNYDDLSKKLF